MPVGQCKFTADIFKRNNNIDFCNIMGFFFQCNDAVRRHTLVKRIAPYILQLKSRYQAQIILGACTAVNLSSHLMCYIYYHSLFSISTLICYKSLQNSVNSFTL